MAHLCIDGTKPKVVDRERWVPDFKDSTLSRTRSGCRTDVPDLSFLSDANRLPDYGVS
jgi:hypothetical protein